MIELITILIIVAILATIAIAGMFKEDKLDTAVEELLVNMRYAQHLAVMNDEFNANDPRWEWKRWRIKFSRSSADRSWSYHIFKDDDDSANNVPSTGPNSNLYIARNPLDGQFITTTTSTSPNVRPESSLFLGAFLTREREISDIKFLPEVRGGCDQTIAFDELGRPFHTSTPSSPSDLGFHYIAYEPGFCTIRLTHISGRTADICVEGETGYIYDCTQ
ncbi:MAG: hypothetical protein LBU73_05800 [Helicobacteraceae bacterium]|jgi:hypothetical protein|nr:hypothetical protein [Helicobacteraceae bacterium]